MTQPLLQYIHRQEKKLFEQRRFFLFRAPRYLWLFLLYIAFALHRALFLLFAPPSKSFTLQAAQSKQGTYTNSYHRHVEMQRGLRFFSLSTMLMIVVSSMALLSVMQLVFPASSTEPVRAADNTFTVSTNNNLGPGSLRKAITDANAAVGSVEIVLDIVGTNTIDLATALPNLTAQVTITNNEVTPVRVDGSSLAADTTCWEIASGADGSTIVGLAFHDCTANGLLVSASNVTIGGSAARDNVYAYDNSGNGIQIDGSGATLQDVYVGWPLVTGSGNGDDGLYVAGNNATIDGLVALQNGDDGLEIAAGTSGVTVTDSYFGVRDSLSTSAIGNSSDGIEISGSSNTIGTASSGNVIGGNNGYGIHFTSSSSSNTVRGNTIGMNSDQDTARANTSGGIYMENSTSPTIDGNTIGSSAGPQIAIDGGSTVTITDNYIGTTSANSDFGGDVYGIRVQNAVSDLTIGGSTTSVGNTIAYNDGGGVHIATSGIFGALISHNTFTSNDGEAITIENGAQNSISAPTVSSAGSGAIQGTATASNSVEVYANGTFIGEVSSVDSDGGWELSASEASLDDFSDYSGDSITALQIDSSNNTSEFSTGVTLSTDASSLTVTSSQEFTDSLDVTATIDGGGTLYYTIDGSTPTTSSTSALSPLSLTMTETTTLQIFGVDANSNTTDTVSATYTNTTDSNDSNDSDGADDSGNGDNTETDDALGSNPVDISYLQPQQTRVNGVPVGLGEEPLYTPVDDVRLRGLGANPDHQVRVGIERKKTGNQVDKKWVNVSEDGIWKRTVGTTLKKGATYEIKTRARKENKPNTTSKEYTVGTIVASNPAPTIATLSGAVTVTTTPDELVFGGVFQQSSDSAQFRVVDEYTGSVVASCTVKQGESGEQTKNGACSFDNALPNGDYRVLFHSVEGDLLSAPDAARLTVTPAVDRAVLNLDKRSNDFNYRITTSSNPKLIGIGPENTIPRVYIDGKLNGEATFTSNVGWEYTLNLDSVARGDHEILVKFYSGDNELSGDRIRFPFRFADKPVDVLLASSIPGTVTQGNGFSATIVGAKGDTVTMKRNGSTVGTFTLDTNAANGFGSNTVLLPTNTVGAQSVQFVNENSIGLEGKPLDIAYTVVQPVESTSDQENAGEDDAEVNEDDPSTEDTGAGTLNDTDDNVDTTEIEADAAINTVELSDGTIISVEEIPEQWNVPPQTEIERIEIQERLEQLNQTQISVSAETVLRDADGNILSRSGVEKNEDGVTVLRQVRTSGIDAVLPWFADDEEEQTIEFSGTTDPYALVRLTVRSDPIVQFDRADETGEWKMNVAVAALPPGEHSAYVQTTSKGVESEEIEIAKFVVVEEERISTTTWIFIVNILVIIIFLLIAVALQFKHRMKRMNKYSTPPVAKKGDALTSAKDAKQLESIAKATEK